jgi:membrane protease YdiL (CAAX protease family)
MVLGVPSTGLQLALAFVAVVLVCSFVLGRSRPSLGFRKIRTSDWADSAAFFGLLFPLALLGRLLDPSFDGAYASAIGLVGRTGITIFLLTLPFYLFREELFLRFTQNALSRIIGASWAMLALSANFAILHYPFGLGTHAWSVLPSVLLGSVVLCLLFLRTQNIWITFFVHVAFDAVITVQIFFHASGAAFAEGMLWAGYGIICCLTLRRALNAAAAAIRQHAKKTAPWAGGIATCVAIALAILLVSVRI